MADQALILEAYTRFGQDPAKKSLLDELARRSGMTPLAGIPRPQGAQQQMRATDTRGFGRSFLDAVNPIPAIQDYIQNGPPLARGLRAMSKLDSGQPLGEEDDPTRLGAEGNILTDLAAPGVTAWDQAAQGNTPGALGTLAGGYGVPAAIGAVTPTLVKNAPRMAASAMGAAKGAAQGAVETVPPPFWPQGPKLPAPVYGAVYGALSDILPGIRTTHPVLGPVSGALAPVVSGAIRGMKEGWSRPVWSQPVPRQPIWQGGTPFPPVEPVEPVTQPSNSPSPPASTLPLLGPVSGALAPVVSGDRPVWSLPRRQPPSQPVPRQPIWQGGAPFPPVEPVTQPSNSPSPPASTLPPVTGLHRPVEPVTQPSNSPSPPASTLPPVTGLHRPDVPPHYSGHITQDAAYKLDQDISRLAQVRNLSAADIRKMPIEEYNTMREIRAKMKGIKATAVKPEDFETRREQLAKTHELETAGVPPIQ